MRRRPEGGAASRRRWRPRGWGLGADGGGAARGGFLACGFWPGGLGRLRALGAGRRRPALWGLGAMTRYCRVARVIDGENRRSRLLWALEHRGRGSWCGHSPELLSPGCWPSPHAAKRARAASTKGCGVPPSAWRWCFLGLSDRYGRTLVDMRLGGQRVALGTVESGKRAAAIGHLRGGWCEPGGAAVDVFARLRRRRAPVPPPIRLGQPRARRAGCCIWLEERPTCPWCVSDCIDGRGVRHTACRVHPPRSPPARRSSATPGDDRLCVAGGCSSAFSRHVLSCGPLQSRRWGDRRHPARSMRHGGGPGMSNTRSAWPPPNCGIRRLCDYQGLRLEGRRLPPPSFARWPGRERFQRNTHWPEAGGRDDVCEYYSEHESS